MVLRSVSERGIYGIHNVKQDQMQLDNVIWSWIAIVSTARLRP